MVKRDDATVVQEGWSLRTKTAPSSTMNHLDFLDSGSPLVSDKKILIDSE